MNFNASPGSNSPLNYYKQVENQSLTTVQQNIRFLQSAKAWVSEGENNITIDTRRIECLMNAMAINTIFLELLRDDLHPKGIVALIRIFGALNRDIQKASRLISQHRNVEIDLAEVRDTYVFLIGLHSPE